MAQKSVLGVIAGALALCAVTYLHNNEWHLFPATRQVMLWRGHTDGPSYYEPAVPLPVRYWGGNAGPLRAVAFSPDGTLLASGDGSGSVLVWNFPAGTLHQTLAGQGDVDALAFSPDGKALAVSSRTGTVLWNTKTWTQQAQTFPPGFMHIAFSPDGKTLAICGAGKPSKGSSTAAPALYDVATGTRKCVLRGHTDSVPGIAFSPNDRLVATASYDHTVKIWDAASGRLVRDLKSAKAFGLSLAFTRDGKELAEATTDDTVEVWDIPTGVLVATTEFVGQCWALAFSPDGRRLAAAGAGVCLFDTTSWKREYVLQEVWGWPGEYTSGDSLSVAFSPDGKTLAFGNSTLVVSQPPPQ